MGVSSCASGSVPVPLQLYPYECQERLVDFFTTGDEVTVDLSKDMLINHTTGEIKIRRGFSTRRVYLISLKIKRKKKIQPTVLPLWAC